MPIKITPLFFVFFCFCINASGQIRGLYNSEHKFNSKYIESFSDSLILKLAVVQKFTRLEIEDNFSKNRIEFSPNRDISIGAGFQYKWLGLTFTYKMPGVNNDDDKFGETTQLDLQASLYLRKFVVDFDLHRYKGFYIDNPRKLYPDRANSDPYPQRDDLTTTFIGGDVLYIFNHKKFSYRAAFIQNELQKKSAGSFILGAYFSRLRISADGNIINPELENLFSKDIQFETASYSNYGVSVGYAHTFVIKKKFFISISPNIGGAIQYSKIDNVDPELNATKTEFAPKIFSRFSAGYHWNKYFIVATSQVDNFLLNKTANVEMDYSVGNIRFFIGRKFNIN